MECESDCKQPLSVSNADKISDSRTAESKPPKFKAPILIGKIGRFPKKVFQKSSEELKTVEVEKEEKPQHPSTSEASFEPKPAPRSEKSPAETLTEKSAAVPYKEPLWSGIPDSDGRKYSLEVLKSGVIIDRLDLMTKPYFVFGRFGNCDVIMAHPTISRHHAVLQFRATPEDETGLGFYLYDLNSTHGTFLNKNRLKPRVHVKVHVGHMMRFGCSTRSYILDGPVDDEEDESELSVTELKAKRAEDLRRREEEAAAANLKAEQDELERKKREEERGVSWGMNDDDEEEEEADLSENPYASTNNEELYLDDPKKALRGFMEREGLQFEYDCTEQGVGTFCCKVELPVDDDRGRPIVAEVVHKGKKKDAVMQCALEACRILDRFGLLRQATHESRKRKSKNWEENDFYDSDDDTFLDRTGSIEQKRQNRIKRCAQQQPETYQALVEKETELSMRMLEIENQLAKSREQSAKEQAEATGEDSLDSFMKSLKSDNKLDKPTISRLKLELASLKVEHIRVVKLANIAKPAELPPIAPQVDSAPNKSSKSKLPIFGKRLKVKVEIPKPKPLPTAADDDDDNEVEYESVKPKPENQSQLPQSSAHSSGIKTNDDSEKDTKIKLIKSDTFKRSSIAEIEKEKAMEMETSTDDNSKEEEGDITEEEKEKRRKKNDRVLHRRQGKMENQKQRGYQEDATKEDYNMWVPPDDQSGDGRTSLNDKLGY